MLVEARELHDGAVARAQPGTADDRHRDGRPVDHLLLQAAGAAQLLEHGRSDIAVGHDEAAQLVARDEDDGRGHCDQQAVDRVVAHGVLLSGAVDWTKAVRRRRPRSAW